MSTNPFEVIEARLSNIENLLLDIKHPIRVLEPLPDRIELDEACKLTNQSKGQMYKLTMLNKIPHQKFGKRLVFSRKALTEWLEEKTVSPSSPSDIMDDRLAKSAKKQLKKG
jgi:excisionase family DNA binding protein